MPLTDDSMAAERVQEHLATLYKLIHQIETIRRQSEDDLVALKKQGDCEISRHFYQTKLRKRYKMAINYSRREEEYLRGALKCITEIRNIKTVRRVQARTQTGGSKEAIRSGTWMKMLMSSAQTLPLFVGGIGETVPPLCGAVPAEPNHVAKVGDMVTALVTIADGDNGDDSENWIVAEVVSAASGGTKYEVDDILAEQNQQSRHVLSKRAVVPLPLMRANPETHPEALFAEGAVVMALYPTTSCFYKGMVNKPPANYNDSYEILFEDTDCTGGYSKPMQVAQRYVIAIKNKPKV